MIQIFLLKQNLFTKLLILFLSALGIIICMYLLYLYSQPQEIQCATNCQFVRESEYSSFFGISLPVLGFLFYLIVFIYFFSILFVSNFKKRNYIFSYFEEYIVFFVLTIGFVFSIYLTYIEAFILGAFCDFCLMSAFVSVLMFLVYLFYIIRISKRNIKTF